MKHETGNWYVERDCHRGAGVCFRCKGTLSRTKQRLVQGTGYSKAYAKFVAANWYEYNPTVRKLEVAIYA